MKIAYVGNFIPAYSTENDVKSAFESLGHEVVPIQENQFNLFTDRQTILESNLVLITSTWDSAIPLTFWLTLMKECAERGIPTATLHLDTFWSTPRNGRQWWLNPMFHTAYIFTADGDYQEQWKAYGKNHIWLPPAVRHTATKQGKYREEYACDVAFVGSNGTNYHNDVWSYRTELVNFLRTLCRTKGWTFKNPGGDDPKIERSDDMNDFYASAKVTVGDSLCLKKEDSHYWSDRVPECLGRHGKLIMPRINILEDIYKDMIPNYEWGDWSELEHIIARAVGGDELFDYQWEDCYEQTKQFHTYVQRAEAILEEVGL